MPCDALRPEAQHTEFDWLQMLSKDNSEALEWATSAMKSLDMTAKARGVVRVSKGGSGSPVRVHMGLNVGVGIDMRPETLVDTALDVAKKANQALRQSANQPQSSAGKVAVEVSKRLTATAFRSDLRNLLVRLLEAGGPMSFMGVEIPLGRRVEATVALTFNLEYGASTPTTPTFLEIDAEGFTGRGFTITIPLEKLVPTCESALCCASRPLSLTVHDVVFSRGQLKAAPEPTCDLRSTPCADRGRGCAQAESEGPPGR